MKIYIAGPITGRDGLNEEAFRLAAKVLKENRYWTPVVPHDIEPHKHSGDCPPSYTSAQGGHGAACYLRTDLREMLTCDAVFVLEGWENSTGAMFEYEVASMCGLPIYWDIAQVPELRNP